MSRDFSVWPWFWLAVLLWLGLALTRPPGVTPFSIGAALAAVSALILLVIGVVQSIRRRRK